MSTTDDPDPGDGGPVGITLAVAEALVRRFGEGAQQVCAQQVTLALDHGEDAMIWMAIGNCLRDRTEAVPSPK